MKKFWVIVTLAFAFAVAGVAHAQSNANGTSNAGATATVGGSGAELNYAPTTNNGGSSFPAATAMAPGLVAGFKTCMGSFSNGFQIKDFGWATGKTYTDEDCQASEFGTTLWNQGFRAAAIGVLCSRPLIRYAFATTGGIPYTREDGTVVHRKCPMTPDEWHAAGEPLLEPISGQPYSDAQLNPPMRPIVVAAAPLTPEQQQQAANAALIEKRAADMARAEDAAKNAPVQPAKKPVRKAQKRADADAPATVAAN